MLVTPHCSSWHRHGEIYDDSIMRGEAGSVVLDEYSTYSTV